MGVFQTGDKVEISMNEEGLVGSYYAATILYPIVNDSYIIQYKTLLKEDESGPLREIVSGDAVRQMPPPPAPATPPATACFFNNDKVDAFYNDGWWVGMISGKASEIDKYYVWFDSTKEEIAYSVSELRGHMDWVNGSWICPNKRIGDTLMLANTGGKERTELEWKTVLYEGGFPRYKIIPSIPSMAIIEAYPHILTCV